MKILVLSDIHANINAFDAVLAAEQGKYAACIFLGDITGYGPDPEPCIRRLRELEESDMPTYFLTGNHDAALLGKIPLEWFNDFARRSVMKMKASISSELLEWLAGHPALINVTPDVCAAHGSPRMPLTEYLFGGEETAVVLADMAQNGIRICFVGHTHEAAIFTGDFPVHVEYPQPEQSLVPKQFPIIINPGSVGFPRSFHAAYTETESTTDSPISMTSYPAYYVLWDTDDDRISFKTTRYDRYPVEKKLGNI